MTQINPYRPYLYFGCVNRPGHYVHDQNLQSVQQSFRQRWPNLLQKVEQFDGSLLPETDLHPPYTVYLTVFEGIKYTAFAFWDFTGDTRGGSNSCFWCPTLSGSAEDLWIEIQRRFPKTLIERFPLLNFEATTYKPAERGG